MSDSNTLRVLSFDGGGMRGYLSQQFMVQFCQLSGINPNEIWKHFDVITGTSIGGIIALALAFGLSLDSLTSFFTDDGKWIFTIRTAGDVASGSHNASTPSNRPNAAQKVVILGNNDQFYNSAYPDSNYGSVYFKQRLVSTFGTNTLQNLKTNVLITSYKDNTKSPVLFSNLNYAEYIGQNELISNVALATSSAPLYLPPLSLGMDSLIDGGVYQNNPARLGLVMAKSIRSTVKRVCVLSVGTGLGEVGFDEAATPGFFLTSLASLPFEDTIKSLVGLLDATIGGAQEAVHKGLSLEEQYTLDNLYYYRFQVRLDPAQDNELDNSDASYLAYLAGAVTQRVNEDIDDLTNFIGHFLA